MPDQWSAHMTDRRGARRPVDEGAYDPKLITLNEPGTGWHAMLLRDYNELLLNIGEFGLTDGSAESRELLIDMGAMLVFNLRENPQMTDDELDDIALYAYELFGAMSASKRIALKKLADSERWRRGLAERLTEWETASLEIIEQVAQTKAPDAGRAVFLSQAVAPAGRDPRVVLVTETEEDWTVHHEVAAREVHINLAHLAVADLDGGEAPDRVAAVAADVLIALRDGLPRSTEALSVRAACVLDSLDDLAA